MTNTHENNCYRVFILANLHSHWRTDAEPEAPILWPPDVKSQLIGKDPDAGVTEDEMVGWHHRLDRHEIVGDRGAWRASVHGIAKSWTQLSF